MRALVLALVAVVASGCYDTPRPQCAFLCGIDNACPVGYGCATDGWCKLDGVADSFVCEPSVNDASLADAVSDAAGPDAGADAPDIIDADVDAAQDGPEPDGPADAAIDAPQAALAIITANPLDFGTVVQTQSELRTVTLRNGGGAATSAITLGVTGSAAYALVTGATDTCTGVLLAPSTSCTFEVRYTPTGVGPAAGVAQAMATEGGSVSINLTGMSTAALTGPATVPFGSQATSTMASMMVTFTNAGAVTTGTITTTPPTGAFSILTDGCNATTVIASGTCDVTVQFAPTATGAQTSSFTLDATPGGPRTVMLTGTGI